MSRKGRAAADRGWAWCLIPLMVAASAALPRVCVAREQSGDPFALPSFVHLHRESGRLDLEVDGRDLPLTVSSYSSENDGKSAFAGSGFELNQTPGEPRLPKVIFAVALQDLPRAGTLRLTVLDSRWEDLGTGFRVPPAALPRRVSRSGPRSPSPVVATRLAPGDSRLQHASVTRDDSVVQDDPLAPEDPNIYSGDRAYPPACLRLGSPTVRGAEVLLFVELWPLEFHPISGRMRKLEFLRCRVDYDPEPSLSLPAARTRDRSPDTGAVPGAPGVPGVSETKDGYAIITTRQTVLRSVYLQAFIRARERSGYAVRLVTEDDYGASVGPPPNGRAEQIRQWLIDHRQELRLRYVLLIGDPDPDDPTDPADPVGDVPMKMLFPRAGAPYYPTDTACPSDFYYADLTGDWNLDGDELHGEWAQADRPNTPDPRIEPNTFSVRWTGRIRVPDAQGLRLAAGFDDGARIWVDELNGPPAIDQWSGGEAGARWVDIPSGGLHDIRVEYRQRTSNAYFRLLSGPVGSHTFGLVSKQNLYYRENDQYRPGGLNGEYFNDEELGEPVFSRIDPDSLSWSFDLRWFSGDRGPGGVDLVPEVTVGRIPVYSSDYAGLDRILAKIIRYSFAPDAAWRAAALLPMKPLDEYTPGYPVGEQLRREVCVPEGIRCTRVYEFCDSCETPPEYSPCTEENVLRAWTRPFGVVTWSAHGNPWEAPYVFRAASCPRLSDRRPAAVFLGSCDNGWPEYADNLGVSLLHNGAVAAVAASRAVWYNPGRAPVAQGNRMFYGFVYFCTANLLRRVPAGDALSRVQSVPADLFDEYVWMNVMSFNLYGDPSLGVGPPALPDSTAPSRPLALTPAAGGAVGSSTPRFSWSASRDLESGVKEYSLRIAPAFRRAIDSLVRGAPVDSAGAESVFTVADTAFVPPAPLADGTYTWSVQAVDFVGNAGASASGGTLQIDTEAPPAPAPVEPTAGAWVAGPSILLRWSPSSTASRYNLEVEREGDPGTPVYAGLVDTTELAVTPRNSGFFTWRVRAMDRAGNASAFSPTLRFGADLDPPAPVSALAPRGGVALPTATPAFSWRAVHGVLSGVDHYDLLRAGDPGFERADTTLVTDTMAVASSEPLTEGISYWRVRAVSRVGRLGPWSAPDSFFIDTRAPDRPVTQSPPAGAWLAAPMVRFDWSRVRAWAGAAARSGSQASSPGTPVRYSLAVSRDSLFSDPAVVLEETLDRPILIRELGEGRYSWRVRAEDQAGNTGPWSDTGTFGVDLSQPGIPTPTAPDDGAMADTLPRLRWNPAGDPLSGIRCYQVLIEEDRRGQGRSWQEDLNPGVCPQTLEPGTYRWRVRAVDGAGNPGSWSEPARRFTLLPRLGGSDLLVQSPGDAGGVSLFYRLAGSCRPTLEIFDLRGKLLRSYGLGKQAPGVHRFVWDGTSADGMRLPSGIVFYRLVADGRSVVRKGLMIR